MRSKPLPTRTRAEVLDYLPTIRQSILARYDECRLMTRWGLEGVAFSNPAQARGILFHRFGAEILRTLWCTGNTSIPTEEAMAVLYEVVAQRNVSDREVVWLPAVERRLLRKCAFALVWDRATEQPREFDMARLIAIEGTTMDGGPPLEIPVRYPGENGVMVDRVITGRPDAILADPPDGLEILDWKTDRQPPPKGEEDSHVDDAEHVSYQGYFQQRTYGTGVLRRWPSIQRVRLREFYVLAGEARWGSIHRVHMEHIERELTAEVELLDRALMGGHKSAIWSPQPGKHCNYCPRPGQCPIPKEERGAGAISSDADAKRYGAQAVVATRVRKHRIEAMKAWLNQRRPDTTIEVKVPPGIPIKAAKGRAEWRFRNGRFGLYVPETSDRGPEDERLAAAMNEARERASA